MTKSGSKKSKHFSGTDATLIIIAAFCLSVVIFIGFNCCFKRRKRKDKAKQRKFGRKKGHHEQDDLLNEPRHSEESLNCEAEDLSRSEDNLKNHKTDSPPTTPQNNHSFLSRIMSSMRQSYKKGDTESAQKNDSKTANTSKRGSSTSQKENSKKDTVKAGQKKKVCTEIKQKESGKSSKEVEDSKPSNSNTSVRNCPGTPTETHPLNESAQLCGIKTGDKSKVTRTKKQSNCNSKNSCKSCSLHNRDEDNNAGHDSMESTGKGDPSTSRGGKGKGGKSDYARRCDQDSMETGGGSTYRDKRGKGRRSPEDYSSGEYDSHRDHDSREMGGSNTHRDKSGKEQGNSRDSSVKAAKDPGRQQDGGGGSMLTRSKAKDSGKTAIQGIRGSLDDGHGSLETEYDMCDVVEENIQKTDVEHTYVNLHDDDDMGKEEGRDVEQRDKKDEQNARNEEPSARNTTAREPEMRIESIGEEFNVIQYAMKEWKSDTQTAKDVRNGYREIPSQLGLNDLRVIRGDNYCAIRATLFQVLAQKIPILSQLNDIEKVPRVLKDARFDWIDGWKFGSRLPVGRDKVCEKMGECLKELSNLVKLNAQMLQDEGRVMHLLSNFNFRPIEYEIRLLEAVKFIMLYKAISLYQNLRQDKQVPVFAMIMFARDTSQNPEQFMMNHLNAVGDTGGLEQVEMHLLGYALGITIKVVRPSHVGQPDFIASYPEDMPSGTPVITLVAEDDRHYNILS